MQLPRRAFHQRGSTRYSSSEDRVSCRSCARHWNPTGASARPEKALVLCMDEKSQIHSLDRTQPTLPLCPVEGELQAPWHDHTVCGAQPDRRNVISECLQRHRHQEFPRFLRRICRTVPNEFDLHIVTTTERTRMKRAQLACPLERSSTQFQPDQGGATGSGQPLYQFSLRPNWSCRELEAE
jgi:hypothetical protein